MRKCAVFAGLGLLLLLLPVRANAAFRTIDNVAAATLLLPYFEVDLSDVNGMTTAFTIVVSGHYGSPPNTSQNAGATAALVHITLWTDLGIPTFAFDVYLTGYDVQSINLRSIFDGILPRTASVGQDPGDSISNHGILSQDINFASCNSSLPYSSPALTPGQITDLRDAHLGKASGLLGGNCGARNLGDNIARGFVTIDNVNSCSPLFPPTFPNNTNYLMGQLTDRNLISGDFVLGNPNQSLAQGDALVAIEATQGAPVPAGEYTFYGRFIGGNGADRREPLATQWAVPYQDKPARVVATELIVWRDPIDITAPFPCAGGVPAPFPLGQRELVSFDTAENSVVLSPPQPPFPVVAMRTTINGAAPTLPLSTRAGWLYLNLNSPAAVPASPFIDQSARQSWVMVIKKGEGRFSSGHAAIQLDNAFDRLAK